jgi:hypothetical protein
VQWSSREQLATIDCFETVGYQIGQRNKTHGFFVSMSIMVPVLVYKRPYCYYELIIDFKCHECLNTSLSAKETLFTPGGRWLVVKPSSFEHMLFNVYLLLKS